MNFQKKEESPKFRYIEPVVRSPLEWFKSNTIKATRFYHGIDPLKNNNTKPSPVDQSSFYCIQPNKKSKWAPNAGFESLLEGQSV